MKSSQTISHVKVELAPNISQTVCLYTRDDTSAQQFFYYVNIYVTLHVSTIQVVIRSLIEITGLQKAAHTFWDPN